MNCKNCNEAIKKEWSHCPKCGANLKLGTYSSDDDPSERLTKMEGTLKKVVDHLEKEHKEKEGGKNERRTLFGD